MSVSRRQPGLIVSAAAHATLLAATLVAFNSATRFQDAQEAIPVEMISTSDFSQISKGEKAAKDVRQVQKADKVADKTEQKPTPPIAEAKKDVPLPPPNFKRLPDPGEDEEPKKPEPQKMAALPPPRPVEETRPAPLPPERPQPAKAEPKDERKEEPKEAEAVAPKPPPRPKETRVEPKPEPKPAPTPPEKPRLNKDEIAKLLAHDKPADKAASKPKSGQETDQPKSRFNANDISRLLDHDKPQATGSTGREVVRTASLGAPSGTAPRMSPNLKDAFASWISDTYMNCWSPPLTAKSYDYKPQIVIRLQADGSLAAEPALRNPSADPLAVSMVNSAMQAVRRCNPLNVPAQFKPFYEQWKSNTIEFDPNLKS